MSSTEDPAAKDRPAKLVVTGATKTYQTNSGPLHAVADFSMSIADGEFACIVGPSGCGKTTLLWSIAGLHSLTSGRVTLDGEEITEPHSQIGMVFQEANLLPWRNLDKNIELPFEIKRQKPDRERINKLIDRVGLAGFGNKFPRELSGGMQQRAAIVRALSFNPSVLLMDEPFGALDAFTRDEMNLLVEEIWLETRKTILFVTHNITEAVFLSDRVFVMSARPGRLAKIFDIPFPRPRTLDLLATKEVFDLVNEIKAEIQIGATPANHTSTENVQPASSPSRTPPSEPGQSGDRTNG
ncbi:MAG: ABC transporter ATP-binding protein [Alphaproteobacteria bacterium]|nr:ABC transporter ATP-binding protein [Alphaproteobacteria bacterium]